MNKLILAGCGIAPGFVVMPWANCAGIGWPIGLGIPPFVPLIVIPLFAE